MKFYVKKGVKFNFGICYVVLSGGFNGRQFLSPPHMMTFGPDIRERLGVHTAGTPFINSTKQNAAAL